MRLIHQCRDLRYRKPFGALPCETELTLALEVELEAEESPLATVYLHYAYGLERFERGYQLLAHEAKERGEWAQGSLHLPMSSGLFFYWFEVHFKDGQQQFVVARPEAPWEACTSPCPPQLDPEVPRFAFPFQVTVYEKDFSVPEWFAGQLVYQIFPDRFARDSAWSMERMQASGHADERLYHESWNDEVDIKGKPETGYLAFDFFGGSLKGIEERLDYLQRLGVRVLYLNPIFEARSNHRYDTADYLKIDPMLGTTQAFSELSVAAEARGMRLVLDGVFSHTGADSIYFNKYGRYPSVGAYQAEHEGVPSPYHSWYRFKPWEGTYESWWGFQELPAVHELDLSFQHFILGDKGVLSQWLQRGASGFRLDVSDELPDAFLRALRQKVKAFQADALVLGEVWENASNKVSYGHYRDFLFGRTHDTVMGYPYREACVNFFSGREEAEQFANRLLALRETYPPMAFAASMNLLSSHDVPRFITAVAGAEDPGTREAQLQISLSPEERQRGEALTSLAYALTLLYPGSPSLYYGDECFMEGYRDPFNRRTFPWGQEDNAFVATLSDLAELRQSHHVLQTGDVEVRPIAQRVLALRRYFPNGADLLGREGKGVPSVEVYLNAGECPCAVDDHRVVQQVLPPYSLWLHIGDEGKLYCFGKGCVDETA